MWIDGAEIGIYVDAVKSNNTEDPKGQEDERKVRKIRKAEIFKTEQDNVANNTTYIKQPRLYQINDALFKFKITLHPKDILQCLVRRKVKEENREMAMSCIISGGQPVLGIVFENLLEKNN